MVMHAENLHAGNFQMGARVRHAQHGWCARALCRMWSLAACCTWMQVHALVDAYVRKQAAVSSGVPTPLGCLPCARLQLTICLAKHWRFGCEGSTCVQVPLSFCHIAVVPSKLADARLCPSGDQATERTVLEWACSRTALHCHCCPSPRSHKRTVLSLLQLANDFPACAWHLVSKRTQPTPAGAAS